MKRILLLLAIVLLPACSRSGGDSPEEAARKETNKAIMEQMNHPKPAYRDEMFELKLNLARTAFKQGEPIDVSASFAYVGDRPKITVYGARSFLGFSIRDGKRFAMDGASTAERAPTELVQGKTYMYPFYKSGGYGADDPDADFWRAFYAEKKLILPAGEYVLEASVSFDLREDIGDREPYRASAYATITVE